MFSAPPRVVNASEHTRFSSNFGTSNSYHPPAPCPLWWGASICAKMTMEWRKEYSLRDPTSKTDLVDQSNQKQSFILFFGA